MRITQSDRAQRLQCLRAIYAKYLKRSVAIAAEIRLIKDGLEDTGHSIPVPALALPSWYGRLVFDFNVSKTSPVVYGTSIPVSRVVSLIVDGELWSDILRMHPELTEDDIRACLAYTIDQNGIDYNGTYP